METKGENGRERGGSEVRAPARSRRMTRTFIVCMFRIRNLMFRVEIQKRRGFNGSKFLQQMAKWDTYQRILAIGDYEAKSGGKVVWSIVGHTGERIGWRTDEILSFARAQPIDRAWRKAA